MKKHYTKKQIVEAIRYWTNALKQIDESKSPFLDACSKEFGEDIVFGRNGNERIIASLDMIKNIYNISNNVIFDSKLVQRDIKVNDAIDFSHLKFASYVFASVHNHKKLIYIDHICIIKDKTFYPPYIEISQFMLHIKMPFMYIVSTIVHEMIHQYTVEIGNELKMQDEDMKNKKEHNPHGDEFKKLMDNINEKYGLSIKILCNLNNIDNEFKSSIISAQKMLESKKENKNIIYDSEYMTIEKPTDEEIYITHLY